MNSSNDKSSSTRIKLLALVDTPIRFFTLILLVIEALMGALVLATTGAVQLIFVAAMILLLLALVAIVAYFAFERPEAIYGRRVVKQPVNLSTGMVNLLKAIDREPNYPRSYGRRLHHHQTPRTTPWVGTDPVAKAGWEKAAIYGCMFLVQVGYAAVNKEKIYITEAGESVYTRLIGSSTVDGPYTVSDEELFYDMIAEE